MPIPSIHIKANSELSADESDEIVAHQMPDGYLLLEIYQGPGLGTNRTQTTLDPLAVKALREFISPGAFFDPKQTEEQP